MMFGHNAFHIPLLSTVDDSSLLTSIGAHLAFGFVVLFYGVQKFFEEVEKKLNADTKLEISVWLLDLHSTRTVKSWQSISPKLFNEVFGYKHFSWKCFWRSSVVTACVTLFAFIADHLIRLGMWPNILLINFLAYGVGVFGNILPDYVSLWKTRYLIERSREITSVYLNLLLVIIDILASVVLGACAVVIASMIFLFLFGALFHPIPIASYSHWMKREFSLFFLHGVWFTDPMELGAEITVCFIPSLFGRLWLIVYVGSGLLLKFGRRLDIGFAWFNRRFDVEEHPLQCIGFVAGTLSAASYWLLATFRLLP